ncbi:hypothetical protein FRC03_001090 [Tulasnella sp. 419]|nr:hypothetical protein FRC03_001090 [Tulasnella sp. 419]
MAAARTKIPSWLLRGVESEEYVEAIWNGLMSRERMRHTYSTVTAYTPDGMSRKNQPPFFKTLLQPKSLSQEQLHYSIKVGTTPPNDKRNRYRDISPYDQNTVMIATEGIDGGRYLNASWVKELKGEAWWVAGQAPLQDTIHAFLSMFTSLQPESLRLSTIVQLTPQTEFGRPKADQYIPYNTKVPLTHYPEPENSHLPWIEVHLNGQTENEEAQCTISDVTLRLVPRDGNSTSASLEEFPIKHIQYNAWPDHGVPRRLRQLSALARVASEVNQQQTSSPRPIMCHCSAGVGRTGTFITISSLMRAYGHLPKVEHTLSHLSDVYRSPEASPLAQLKVAHKRVEDDVAEEVDGLREQRVLMVQKEEQLAAIYLVILDILQPGKEV